MSCYKVIAVKKFIYKIQNKINGKIYIGQTNNLKRRIQEHKHDRRMNHPIHNAIEKYGFDNFDISLLYYGENYNYEEKKYMKLFKSNCKEFGYNITDGGQDSSGENNPQSKLKQNQVDSIIKDLFENKLSLQDIANKYNTTINTVRNINTGISWKNNELTYPIRKPLVKPIDENKVDEVINLLKNSDMSLEEITIMHKINVSVVYGINKGVSHKRSYENYPIRDITLEKKIRRDKIINSLYTEKDLSIKEIAKKYNMTFGQIYRINKGESWYDDSIKYPIRNTTTERNELGQYKCGKRLLTQMVD